MTGLPTPGCACEGKGECRAARSARTFQPARLRGGEVGKGSSERGVWAAGCGDKLSGVWALRGSSNNNTSRNNNGAGGRAQSTLDSNSDFPAAEAPG